jgi:hypothetical protein
LLLAARPFWQAELIKGNQQYQAALVLESILAEI